MREDSNALALQSIIAVTQNEKGKALDLARKAAEADPKSATARIALSYAQQAGSDLPGALKSVEEAVKLAPQNALAWARLAELRQSFGKPDEGRREIEIAMSLDPDNSLIRSYPGKACYEEKRDKLATGQFDIAKNLDPLDPTPEVLRNLLTGG